MIDIREQIKASKSVADLLDLLNELVKEDMGINFYPYNFQQLNFYSNTNSVPTEKRYHIFKIPKKKKGEFRNISSPVKQLRNIQFYVKLILDSLYEPDDCVMGFVRKKSVVDNAKKHINKYYVLNLDIKDFFPSVTQEMIYECLTRYPYHINYSVASMIARLCCIRTEDGKKVLPQGSPTSPILANMVCRGMDKEITNLARKFNLDYTRYADDITLSSQYNSFNDDGNFMKGLNAIIEKYNFKINPDKKRIQKHGTRQEVTGVIVSSKTNVRRKYVKEIRVMLHNWETFGYDKAYKRFAIFYLKNGNKKYINVPDLKNVIEGKLEYLKMVKGIGDMTYLRLKDRFDRLDSQSETKVIKSWLWCDFEKEKGVKLEAQKSPTSKDFYIDFSMGNKTQHYFIPHYLDLSNKEKLQIDMMQRGEEMFYRVSEVDDKDSLLLLLDIK